MPTQCKPLSFAFQGCQGRRVAAAFDGGAITSNAGVLLLREIDRSVGLLDQVAGCFTDYRDPRLTEHSVGTLVRQRVMGITLGYEDLNDHDQLRHDPVLALLSGKLDGHRKDCAPLAGKSTLNRLEHAPPSGEPGRYHRIGHDADALQAVLLESFIDSWKGGRPSRLVLDIDATDDEVHGRQEGRFFHGYYGHYCFLPLYITCGGRPLFAQLRPGNADPAGGVTGPLGRIVERLRERWPGLEILLRADASYAREEILAWCEGNGVDYVIGLARNSRLVEKIGWELADAQAEAKRRGRPARRFKEFLYATLTSWSRKRRVVAKAEHLPGKANPRFVVTTRCPTPSRPGPSTSASTARGATWRTRSRSSSSISSPTGPRRRASPPTSSGSSSPPSPRSSSLRSGVRCTAPAWPAPPPERCGSSSSRSAPASRSRCEGSRSPWTPHTRRPPPSHASTPDCQGNDSTPPSRQPFQPILRGPLRRRTKKARSGSGSRYSGPPKTRPQSRLLLLHLLPRQKLGPNAAPKALSGDCVRNPG